MPGFWVSKVQVSGSKGLAGTHPSAGMSLKFSGQNHAVMNVGTKCGVACFWFEVAYV